MQSLTCTGAELAVSECEWSAADASCSSHASDSVVFCAGAAPEPPLSEPAGSDRFMYDRMLIEAARRLPPEQRDIL